MEPTTTGRPAPAGLPSFSFRVQFGLADDATITVIGELDVATAPTLDQALHSVRAAGVTAVRVDAHGLSFIDCRGFDVVERHACAMHREGAHLCIVAPSAPVERLLELVGARWLLAS